MRFITIDGERKTLAQWARSAGITRQALDSRLKSGWSDEDAVTLRSGAKKTERQPERYDINGLMMSVAEIAQQSKQSETTVYKRIAAGERGKSLMQRKRRGRPSPELEIDGEVRTVAEWCREYGVSPSCFHNRVNAQGMSPQEAVTTGPRKRGRRKSSNARMLTVGGEEITL